MPVLAELQLGVKQLDARLMGAMQQKLAREGEKLAGLARGLPKPSQLLEAVTQRLDDWSERLHACLPAMVARKEQQLAVLAASLRPQALLAEVARGVERLGELQARLDSACARNFGQKAERLESLVSLLESVNYQKVLARGFALVRDAGGMLVTTAQKAKENESLTIVFADGGLKVKG